MKNIVFFIVFLSVACFGAQKIKVGIDPVYPPFEYRKDGKVAGFDVDFAKELGKRVGFEIEIIDWSKYEEMCKDINDGNIDIGISNFGIDEFTQNCDYSNSYYESRTIFLKLKDRKDVTYDNLAGKKIGYIESDSIQELIKQLGAVPVEREDGLIGLYFQLQSGNIDAIITDSTSTPTFINQDKSLLSPSDLKLLQTSELFGKKDITIFHKLDSDESETVVIFPNDGRLNPLKESINQAIKSMKEDGFLQDLANRYSIY